MWDESGDEASAPTTTPFRAPEAPSYKKNFRNYAVRVRVRLLAQIIVAILAGVFRQGRHSFRFCKVCAAGVSRAANVQVADCPDGEDEILLDG